MNLIDDIWYFIEEVCIECVAIWISCAVGMLSVIVALWLFSMMPPWWFFD